MCVQKQCWKMAGGIRKLKKQAIKGEMQVLKISSGREVWERTAATGPVLRIRKLDKRKDVLRKRIKQEIGEVLQEIKDGEICSEEGETVRRSSEESANGRSDPDP